MNTPSLAEKLAREWWATHANAILDPQTIITAEKIERSLAEMIEKAMHASA